MKRYSHHKKLSLVAELSDLSIIITNKYGETDWVNNAFEEKFGYKLIEIVGKKPGTFLQGEASDIDTINYIRNQLIDKVSFNAEIVNYTRQQKLVWLNLFITPIFEEDEHVGYLSIQTDISIRKEYEAALLKAKEDADVAAKAKVHFVSVISHELRTPLNAILGFTDILNYENPREDQLSNLNMLQFSANNLMVLINDVLDFGKVNDGRTALDALPFNLGEIANNLYKNFLPTVASKRITFLYEVDNNLPKILLGDPARLLQILTNLLSNAIKFTREGTVKLSIKVASVNDLNAAIFFAITDTGIGIPKNKQVEIFEPFSQEDLTISKKFGGTGLGLSIASKLVRTMGSNLEVESNKNEGASFYFTLTLPTGNNNTLKPLADEYLTDLCKRKMKGKKILIAEDNEMNAIVVKKMLQRWPVEIQIAKNGIEAIELHEKSTLILY